MSQPMSFRAHYDGKSIVPDEPVSLPAGQPLIISIHETELAADDRQLAAEKSKEQRREAFRKLMELSSNDPLVPLDALRRVNLYEDGRY